MTFYNIFSSKKTREANKILEIIVDIHEKNSLVLANLIEKGVKTELKSIEIGDYLVGNIVIERKTLSDFISSMLNERLMEQLKNMQQYEQRLLILEKNNKEYTKINMNAIRGMILSISLSFKIPIIFTEDEEETAEYLFLLAKQNEKGVEPALHSKIPKTKEEQRKYILDSFPGIGPRTSDKLLKKYKDIKTIINLQKEELRGDIGKKADIFFDLIN